MAEPDKSEANPLLRLVLEMGPLVAFFVTNARTEDFFAATRVFMIAIVIALLASRVLEKRWPVMPLVTAVFVLVFGGLTLLLEDETFMKLKPTIVNVLFAGILLGGLAKGKLFVKLLFGSAMQLEDEGWRILTQRWAMFFVFLAGLNEFVHRTFSTDTWVSFKVWGIMPLTVVFMMTQMPLMQRYAIEEEGAGGDEERGEA